MFAELDPLRRLKHEWFTGKLNYRDRNAYNQAVQYLENLFCGYSHILGEVKKLAWNIKCGIEKINPFIQQCTEIICPSCKDVCCTNKHGYYNYEDLIYLHALGINLPEPKFGGNDSDPCHFLTPVGCSLDRTIRPSGCNWYFCDSLSDYMEKTSRHYWFDTCLTELAELWLKLTAEFNDIVIGQD
ncbi:MAG: hypothetical protein AB1390_08150 [Nitrospirota bacterium]